MRIAALAAERGVVCKAVSPSTTSPLNLLRPLGPRGGHFIAGIFALFFLAFPGAAQSTFGSITGMVSDPSGGMVPNAKVWVTNLGTQSVRETTTGTAGVYNVPNLDLGTYLLRVSADGFTTYERTGLRLVSNQVLNINVTLEVGATSSVVQVEGTAPTITTETNDLTSTMTSTAVQKLPMVARHAGDSGIFGYLSLNTGVLPDGSVQGTRSTAGAIPTIDGIAVMAHPFGSRPVQPSLETVEEISIVKAGGQAEYATAANIKVITKSGTNEFHGGGFWEYNGHWLNARNFFSPTVPFRVYNNFGASLGGPIVRNKLFFYFAYEGGREAAKRVSTADVPLAAWRDGDFSSLLASGTVIKDPATGLAFAENRIPASRLSNVSQKIQERFYPLPNFGPAGTRSGNWRLNQNGTNGFSRMNHIDARGDYNIGNSDVVFARITWRRLPLEWDNMSNLPGVQRRQSKAGVFSWNHTISPTMVNEFRFGASYHNNPYWIEAVGSDILKDVGIQGISTGPYNTAPVFYITGVSATPWEDSLYNPVTNYQWIDNVSITRGKHLMKFGVDAGRVQVNGESTRPETYGAYTFSGIYSGFGYADFLLGIPQTTR